MVKLPSVTSYLALIAAMTLSVVSRATTPVALCLMGFASVSSDDPNGETLVAMTYAELLDRLGGPVKPETLAALQKSKNPFVIPDQPGTDLQSLQRRMQEFEAMVKANGWHTPEITARLRRDIGRRHSELLLVANQSDGQLRSNVTEPPISLPNASDMTISADGRYLVSYQRSGATTPWGLHLFDRLTKKALHISNFPFDSVAPHFGPDGALWFPLDGGDQVRVPFKDGVLDVPKWERIGTKNSASYYTEHYRTADPNLFYAGRGSQAFRYDVRDNSRIPVDFAGFLSGPRPPGRHLRNWAPVPQSTALSLIVAEDRTQTVRLEMVTVDGAGTLTRSAGSPLAVWQPSGPVKGPDPQHIVWSADGKTPYLWKTSDNTLCIIEAGKLRALAVTSKAQLQTVLVNPREDRHELLVVLQENGKVWANIIDSQTQEARGRVDLPSGTYNFRFSDDGQTLFAQGNGVVHPLAYEARIIR